MTKKTVYTTGEAAKICNISQQTVIRCFDSGLLNGFRVPDSKFRRIPHDCLIAFMHENAIPLYQTRTFFIAFPGEEGMAKVEQTMAKFRTSLPETIAGMHIACVNDYLNLTAKTSVETKPLPEEQKDLVIIELEEPEHYVAIRPSDTELPENPIFFQFNRWQEIYPDPMDLRIEVNMIANLPLSKFQDIDAGVAILQSRLDAMEADVRAVIK